MLSTYQHANPDTFFDNWSARHAKLYRMCEYVHTRHHRTLVLVHPKCGFNTVRYAMEYFNDESDEPQLPRCADPFHLELDESQSGTRTRGQKYAVPYFTAKTLSLCRGTTQFKLSDIFHINIVQDAKESDEIFQQRKTREMEQWKSVKTKLFTPAIKMSQLEVTLETEQQQKENAAMPHEGSRRPHDDDATQ